MPWIQILCFQLFTMFYVPFRPSKWQSVHMTPGMCAKLSKKTLPGFLALMIFALGTSCTKAEPTKSEKTTASKTVSSDPTQSQAPVARPMTFEERPSAAPPPTNRKNRLIRHSGSVTGPIEYLVVEPAPAPEALPLVVALHGWGDQAESFAALAEDLDLPVRTVVARGRQQGGRRGRGWFPRPDPTKEDLAAATGDLAKLLSQLRVTYPNSPKPILYGFSQGGMLALELLARDPSCCRAVAALSARLIGNDVKRAGTNATELLLTMGKRDQVVPAAATRSTGDLMRSMGHRVQYFEFDGRHRIPADARAKLRAFLKGVLASPKKKARPE